MERFTASSMRRHCVHDTDCAVVVHGMPAALRRMHQGPWQADFCLLRLGGLEGLGEGSTGGGAAIGGG